VDVLKIEADSSHDERGPLKGGDDGILYDYTAMIQGNFSQIFT